MLIFQGFANSRIVREFPPFSFKVRIATLTRNAVSPKRTLGSNPSLSARKTPVVVYATVGFSFFAWSKSPTIEHSIIRRQLQIESGCV